MSSTRCKMTVTKKEEHRAWNPQSQKMDGDLLGYTVQLSAVYDPDPESENGSFFQATPCAQVNMSVVNPSGAAVFTEGQEMYVDFTPVEE